MPPAASFLEKSLAKTFNILGPFRVSEDFSPQAAKKSLTDLFVLIRYRTQPMKNL